MAADASYHATRKQIHDCASRLGGGFSLHGDVSAAPAARRVMHAESIRPCGASADCLCQNQRLCFLADPFGFSFLRRRQAVPIRPIRCSAQPFDQHDVFEPAHGVSAAIPIVDRRVNKRIAKLAIDFRVEPERRESSKLAVVCSEANDTYEISSHFSI